jgi:pimeloyl-ACP methyl ester carboxylesterase
MTSETAGLEHSGRWLLPSHDPVLHRRDQKEQRAAMTSEIEHRRVIIDGTPLHYAVAGTGRPLVLIHGFPQTWHQWNPLIARLASQFRIIAPDLRGIGAGPGPASGYDKHSLAADVRAITEVECGDIPALICGHDMGSFVAFAYALLYRSTVAGLMLVDAPPPGTTTWTLGAGSPRAYHINFHAHVDVALMLVTGRERAYISQFILTRAYDSSAITPQDIDVYAAAYSAPGAMRAAFQMYRSLVYDDPELNKRALASGKLEMPVMLVGGSETMPRAAMEKTINEIAINGSVEVIERSGHWIPEERPDALARLVSTLAATAFKSKTA